MLKLDIGSGGKSSDSSFIGVDAFTTADVQALMWDLPYKDGEVDAIFSSNALEHISKYDVVPTLREWKRVLKLGGKLEIVVPDLQWACLWWLHYPQTDWGMDIIYGNQKHEGEFHKTGFTPKIMEQYIDVCGGFEIKKLKYIGNTIEDIAKYGKNMLKPSTRIEVTQRVLDFEILRIDKPSVSQLEEESDSRSV